MTTPYLRNGVYWIRKVVPEPLRVFVGKRELTRSLGTHDPKEARRLAPAVLAGFEAQLEDARKGSRRLSDREIAALAGAWYRAEAAKYAEDPGDPADLAEALDVLLDDAYQPTGDDIVVNGTIVGQKFVGYEEVPFEHADGNAKAILAERGIFADDDSIIRLTWALTREELNLYRLRLKQARDGDWSEDPNLARFPPWEDPESRGTTPSAGLASSSNQPRFASSVRSAAPLASTLIDAFGEWGRKSGGWRAGGEVQAKVSLGLYLEVCGDKPIDSYTRADGDNFRSTLRFLPRTYRKSARDREKPLTAIIAEAEANALPRLTDKTVKRHFWAVSRFFAFLSETGRLSRDAENPGRGFSFNTKGSARTKRDMWSGEELIRLFRSPVWTGCDPQVRSREGAKIIRDALFWLPLLGLFHGNRLEEFAQLHRSDLGQADGVWFLDITDEGGRQLKNAQSRRRVPLHSELIRVGFLDYVARIATSPGDSLFPDLKPGGPDRKLGYGFSKQFSHYRKAIGVKRSGLDYHSFRHGVTTKLYEANVNEGWIDLLTGHENGSESRRRYLKAVSLPQLRTAIEAVTWQEVEISRLYVGEPGDERWTAPDVAPAA